MNLLVGRIEWILKHIDMTFHPTGASLLLLYNIYVGTTRSNAF